MITVNLEINLLFISIFFWLQSAISTITRPFESSNLKQSRDSLKIQTNNSYILNYPVTLKSHKHDSTKIYVQYVFI